MNRIHPNSVKPVARPAGWGDKQPEAEPKWSGIEQRHWVKIFVFGFAITIFGMLEFLSGRPEVSNIFNDPKFAGYWVLTGMALLGASMLVRTWGSR
jgi:hypothetical protein